MSLPLLDGLLVSLIQRKGCLKGLCCIYIQHALFSNVECVEFLLSIGLRKHNIYIIAKAYSTCQEVIQEYRLRGINVSDLGTRYDFTENFDQALIKKARQNIDYLVEQKCENLLLIDEGGIGSRALNRNDSNSFKKISIVELTSRGSQYYSRLDASISVVNVAWSWTKKNVEPKLIASSMITHIERVLKNEFDSKLTDMRVGIVGLGAIGSEILDQLRQICNKIKYFDINLNHLSNSSFDELLINSDVVLSSTGIGMDWTEPLCRLSQRLIFISCGSSDIEFQIPNLKKEMALRGYSFNFSHDIKPWKQVVCLKRNDNEFFFLNGGFPINFDGTRDPIPAHLIQITRAILMAGALQVVESQSGGIRDLDRLVQSELVSAYLRFVTVDRLAGT